jgi:hypothetical protein
MRAVEIWKRRLIIVSISVVPVVTLLLRLYHQPLDRIGLKFTRRNEGMSRRKQCSAISGLWPVRSSKGKTLSFCL